jgi:glycosyltransferase involved in cell wall biosynthesis
VATVYKGTNPQYFKEAVNSVLAQSVKTDDFIIVADGEIPDRLKKAIDGYVKKHRFIRFEQISKNSGVAKARNYGARLAKNELIAIIDDDDISAPDRFAKEIMRFNQESDLSGVGGQLIEFEDNDIDNINGVRKVPVGYEEIMNFSKRRSPINNPTMMWHKAVFVKDGGYPEEWRRGQDYAFVMEILAKGRKVVNLKDVVLFYRLDSDNIKRRSANLGQKIRLQQHFLRRGYIGADDFIATSTGLIAMKIIPVSVKGFLYKHLLRGKAG